MPKIEPTPSEFKKPIMGIQPPELMTPQGGQDWQAYESYRNSEGAFAIKEVRKRVRKQMDECHRRTKLLDQYLSGLDADQIAMKVHRGEIHINNVRYLLSLMTEEHTRGIQWEEGMKPRNLKSEIDKLQMVIDMIE